MMMDEVKTWVRMIMEGVRRIKMEVHQVEVG